MTIPLIYEAVIIPLTYEAIIEIVRDWDIIYIKNKNKPKGYNDPEKYKIFINANQPTKELGLTLFHELAHINNEDNGIHLTESQIESLAKHYYEKTDLLDYIHSFL